MKTNVAQKLIGSHLVQGKMSPGEEIGIAIDQALTQDATGSLVMLELEAMGLQRARTALSVQYVDHTCLIVPANRAGSRPASHTPIEMLSSCTSRPTKS